MTEVTADMTFVRVGLAESVSERVATIVSAGRYEVAIFNVGGTLRAYENACPHQGGPIGEGIVENATVTCPWHAWCFDLRSGSLTIGDFAALRRFALEVRDGAIFVATEPVPEQ